MPGVDLCNLAYCCWELTCTYGQAVLQVSCVHAFMQVHGLLLAWLLAQRVQALSEPATKIAMVYSKGLLPGWV